MIDQVTKAYETGRDVQLGSQPRAVSSVVSDASGGDSGVMVVSACVDQVAVVRDGRKIASLKIDYEGLSVAAGPPDSGDIAVGGQDQKVRFVNIGNFKLVFILITSLFSCADSNLRAVRRRDYVFAKEGDGAPRSGCGPSVFSRRPVPCFRRRVSQSHGLSSSKLRSKGFKFKNLFIDL